MRYSHILCDKNIEFRKVSLIWRWLCVTWFIFITIITHHYKESLLSRFVFIGSGVASWFFWSLILENILGGASQSDPGWYTTHRSVQVISSSKSSCFHCHVIFQTMSFCLIEDHHPHFLFVFFHPVTWPFYNT